MASPAAKPQPNRLFWIVFGGIALGAAVWSLTSEEEVPTVTRKKTTAKTVADKSGMLPEDYSAKFEPIKTLATNTFTPLVVKADPGTAAAAKTSTRDGSMPEALIGEAGWVYTGYWEVDGRPEAILENDKTGEEAVVHTGDRFKNAKIAGVGIGSLVIEGAGGVTRTVKIGGAEKEDVAPATPPAGALNGAIGNPNLNVQPLPAPNGLQPNPNPNFPNQPGQRPRRGGGRRRNNAPF